MILLLPVLCGNIRPPVVLFIKDELEKRQSLQGKRPRQLTHENRVQLRRSIQQILLRPAIFNTYNALAENMAKRFYTRIRVNNLNSSQLSL